MRLLVGLGLDFFLCRGGEIVVVYVVCVVCDWILWNERRRESDGGEAILKVERRIKKSRVMK